MRLLCFGDSNTYGYDPRSCFGSRYPADIRWTDQLAQRTGHEVLNKGMNGRSIPSGGFFSLPPADLLMVMLGSNDLLCGSSAVDTARRMEIFLTQFRTGYPQILLIAPPPMQYGDWVTKARLLAESSALPDLYQAVADRLGIRFADASQWNVELTYDGVHFSEQGHKSFLDGLLRELSL